MSSEDPKYRVLPGKDVALNFVSRKGLSPPPPPAHLNPVSQRRPPTPGLFAQGLTTRPCLLCNSFLSHSGFQHLKVLCGLILCKQQVDMCPFVLGLGLGIEPAQMETDPEPWPGVPWHCSPTEALAEVRSSLHLPSSVSPWPTHDRCTSLRARRELGVSTSDACFPFFLIKFSELLF